MPMGPHKTDEQFKFRSMLYKIHSKILIMVIDAELLDLVVVEEDLKNNTGEEKGI
ncbi:MAG: hypothetical protein ACFFD4_14265 [Candidatus Odinarchaeota archaeon]